MRQTGLPDSCSTTLAHTLTADDDTRECVGNTHVAQQQQHSDVRRSLPHARRPRRQLSGRLPRFVACPVRLHAKTPWLSVSMFNLRTDHGYGCAHCDYLIWWHRARRLRRGFREAGRFRARITLRTPFGPVPCGSCWRMTSFSAQPIWRTRGERD